MSTRRDFIKASVATGAAALASSAVISASAQDAAPAAGASGKSFKLKYAPHFGMFKNLGGGDMIDQLKFMADQGFTALEDNQMAKRPVEEQERIGKELARLNMTMGVFVVNLGGAFGTTTFASPEKEPREKFLADCRNAVEVSKRVNAKWMTVVCGEMFHRLQPEYQTANCVELLKRGCEIFEPHNLVMVLEPLNFLNHPNMLLQRVPHTYLVCKAVNSPSCKILFDMYHQQITEGNLIPNIDLAWDETAYFQIGDNPGRKEPTTGEINYKNVFRHIYNKGFKGVLGMEHGNAGKGPEGEQAVIDAYRACDSF